MKTSLLLSSLFFLPLSVFGMQQSWNSREFEFIKREIKDEFTSIELKKIATNTNVTLVKKDITEEFVGWEIVPTRQISVGNALVFTFENAMNLPDNSVRELFNIFEVTAAEKG